ncbi:hypothetical protein HLH33_15530 [Gluconacetobacter diazotrophicus]|uniref:Uncharacterized protein n=1 Tax=Gluconacetobacter diazotrophicus TaxID=33996 RepID=A0A7W4I7I1_GLUDI|nr:hypothetical protein [Gluconacetobacter diazotrophicus]MBB2157703.1 hypothetical protein [Gluconacetobacter diazotrophicus]
MTGCVAALPSPAPLFATGSPVPAENSTEYNIVLLNVIRRIDQFPDFGGESIEGNDTNGYGH